MTSKLGKTQNPQPILVVEDNRCMREVLALVLRTRGHTVEVAPDGPAALDVVRRFHPSFALVDIGLPAMDGYQLARRLREQEGLGKTVLLALTGHAEPSARRRARRAGFAEHLAKPIDIDRLFAILEGEDHSRGGGGLRRAAS